jgi:CRP-like cAMP-binding protein
MADLTCFPPFTTLPLAERARLRASSVRQQFSKGDVVFEQGAGTEALYVVAAGRLVLQREAPDGNAYTVCHLCVNGIACCLSALDGEPSPARAIAASDARLLRVPSALFAELLRTQPGFAKAALGQIGRQLRQFACDGAPLGDAGTRIATKILSASRQFGSDVPLTRREIAEMAGTAVETAIRETRGFEEAGWISLRRGHIRVLDRQALCVRSKGRCARRSKLSFDSADPATPAAEVPAARNDE